MDKGIINILHQGSRVVRCTVCTRLSASAMSSRVSGFFLFDTSPSPVDDLFITRSTPAQCQCQTPARGHQYPQGPRPQLEVSPFSVSCTQTLSCPSCRWESGKGKEKEIFVTVNVFLYLFLSFTFCLPFCRSFFPSFFSLFYVN